MKRFLLYIAFLTMSLMIYSCKNQDLETNVTIKYGTSFGMCVDYCKRDLTLKGATASYAKSKNGNDPATKTCAKELGEATLTTLRNSFDISAIGKLPDVIGCPDCADGGAEYVEITSNGTTKKITYEYGKTPPALAALIGHLKPIFKTFENCN